MHTSTEPFSATGELAELVRELYSTYGQSKTMGISSPSPRQPHFFLVRKFLRDVDLLVLLNTKRCRYQCRFCTLPAKSSPTFVPDNDVVAQIAYVMREVKDVLSIVDRVTLGNEGSVFDERTLGAAALTEIVRAVGAMRLVRRIVFETRLEFVTAPRLRELAALAPRAKLDVVTGFETVDVRIRDEVLGKREPLSGFLAGLDTLAEAGADLTAYVLFKPDPAMGDADAIDEARASILFLQEECNKRNLSLTVRLNPMYVALGSRWAEQALSQPGGYIPPRLTDAMRVAEWAQQQGVPMFIAPFDENLSREELTFHGREDFQPRLIGLLKAFNDARIDTFPWEDL